MDSKTLVPSQLIAERGSDVVVINPGSTNLRIGLASAQLPTVVPHFIAWCTFTSNRSREASEFNLKSSVGEQNFSSRLLSSARENEREEVFQLIGEQLKLQTFSKEEGRVAGGPRKMDTLDNITSTTVKESRPSPFSWTQVETEGGRMSSSFESSTCNQDSISDLSPGLEDRGMQSLRKFICGEEALKIPSNQPYCLRRPICRGRLNISDCYSLQQVCDDMSKIWDWVLSVKLNLGRERRKYLSAVLVVPDTLDSREIKEMLTVILKDLEFHSAVIHQESVCATFGNGTSSACVVNMGAQVCSIICVEDAVALPRTRVVLPFGGEDITRSLLWIQRRLKNWPSLECDPLHNPLDFMMLNEVKEGYCCIKDGDQRAQVELQLHRMSLPTQICRVNFSALNVPPLGLFYPTFLTPEEYMPLSRPWYHMDTEDAILDDAIHIDSGRRSEGNEVGPFPWSQGSALFSGSTEHAGTRRSAEANWNSEDHLMGISEGIVSCILALGRMDIQKKLFSNIQLVGGVALTPGLIDAIEERVLQAIPLHESIDTVEVIQPRTETNFAAWKGGAVLGVLDSARDTWIQQEDWIEGGIRVGSGRKYKDSYFLQTHTFWYTCS